MTKKCKECGGKLEATEKLFTNDSAERQCICGQSFEITREDEEDALRSLELPERSERPERE